VLSHIDESESRGRAYLEGEECSAERTVTSLEGHCEVLVRTILVLEGKAKGFPMTNILCAINNYDCTNMICTLGYVSVPSFVAIGLHAFILV